LIYFSSDREDILSTVKELAKTLRAPSNLDLLDLVRLAKYLWCTKDVVHINEVRATAAKTVKVQTDSDWDMSVDNRSTSGIRITIQDFLIHSESNAHEGFSALSSGEAEIRALCRGSVLAIYVQEIIRDIGLNYLIVLESDASVAIEPSPQARPRAEPQASRKTGVLYQRTCANSEVEVLKISTNDNLADILTKAVKADVLTRHSQHLGLVPKSRLANAWSDKLELKQVNDFADIQMREGTFGGILEDIENLEVDPWAGHLHIALWLRDHPWHDHEHEP
jgi:hypothetical protein